MHKKSLLTIIVGCFLCILGVGPLIAGIPTQSDSVDSRVGTSNQSAPGELLNIFCSNPYPTAGEPVDLILILKGNPWGDRFEEIVTITDENEGFFLPSTGITWESSTTRFDPVIVTIGKLPTITVKVRWYPIIVGNHSLHVQAGFFIEQVKNISVGFDTEALIYPSLGCPSILRKNETDDFRIFVSEERASTENPLAIHSVTLQPIDGSSPYTFENQSGRFMTWIQTGEKTREDDLIAWYNVSMIPPGFYNISVITEKKTYNWPHAVKIIIEDPNEFTFVQLTDFHIGKIYNPLNEKKELTKKITYINEHLAPDFVVLSGDLVDWYNERSHSAVFSDLVDVLTTCNAPVFTIPGNHERYGNRLARLYFPFYNLTPYHRFLNPLNDYAFRYGSVHFVLLDSGYDYSRWEITSESSGLTIDQLYFLEHQWGDNRSNQIIIMHHPAVNDEDDRGIFAVTDDLPSGNNECIAFHRAGFIEYCEENNVSLVLSGHTHENKVLNSIGQPPDTTSDWPLFVQTDSATLMGRRSGGRIITINNSIIESYEYLPFV